MTEAVEERGDGARVHRLGTHEIEKTRAGRAR
jgi:hypothetical protein